MQMGNIPYIEFYFPYPPVFSYFIFGIMNIYPSIDSFRILASILDIGVAFMIYKIVQRKADARLASTAILAYAILPISVIESGWNGHFEPLANLFLLVAVWFLLKKNYSLSGISIGLAAATKIYPLIIFPILFFYTTERIGRIKFTVSAVITGIITFIPIAVLSWLQVPETPTDESMTSSPLNPLSLLQNLISIPEYPLILVSGFVFLIGIIGVFIIIRPIYRRESKVNISSYYWITVILGVILIVLGGVSGLYPLLPASRFVYWRYPADVGIVRGLTSISVGILVIITVYKERSKFKNKTVSLNTFLVIGSATLLLLLTLSRNVFYGWYLLWSIPIFLLMKDRRLGWIVLLGLLLIYPSYTHDNFNSLGFQETPEWSEGFVSIDGWSHYVNVSNSGLNASLFEAEVITNNGSGEFWFDTSNVQNTTKLENCSIVFTKAVEFDFIETTDFVSRIISSWNPTFGPHAYLSLSYYGVDQDEQPINGSIIHTTGLFTNLTYVLWRFSFSTIITPELRNSTTIITPELNNGTINKLVLSIYPLKAVHSYFMIDGFYTTYSGLWNPIYFVMIPGLIALALVSYIFLDLELRKHKYHYE